MTETKEMEPVEEFKEPIPELTRSYAMFLESENEEGEEKIDIDLDLKYNLMIQWLNERDRDTATESITDVCTKIAFLYNIAQQKYTKNPTPYNKEVVSREYKISALSFFEEKFGKMDLKNFEEGMNVDYDKSMKENIETEVKIKCPCGGFLRKMSADGAFDFEAGVLNCSGCNIDLAHENVFVWHCVSEKKDKHPDGYTLCLSCANLFKEKLFPTVEEKRE